MHQYAKPMVTAASAIALALPFFLADAALVQAQDKSDRQITVESASEDKPAAEAAAPDTSEAKAVAEKDSDSDKDEGSATAEKDDDEVEKTAAKEDEDDDEELDEEDIALALQTELKRVGCYYGALDGIWGPRSRSALHAFGHFGRIKRYDFTPSDDWIDDVKGKKKTVCPRYGHGPGYGPGYGGYGGPPPGGGYGGGYGRGGGY